MPRVRELPRFSKPGDCIMFPGRRRDERGFFLFDRPLDGPNGDMVVGISGEGLRTIAARHGASFGIALAEDVAAEHDINVELEARVAELEAEVDDLRSFKEGVTGLAIHGFDVKKRQGRPAVKKEA